MKEESLSQPCSEITMAIASDAVWVGKKMLESKCVSEPLKILNTLHGVVEISINNTEKSKHDNHEKSVDEYNISAYVYYIKELGASALSSGNSHFSYRCMETLSYLGCNAAKLKSQQTIVAVFESIVHLGRMARNLKIGCFWPRCLIPAESHAEEFMGHILTWLVHDIDSSGDFFMKGYAEQAYSRLRGVKCVIKPNFDYNPCFWIEEIKEGSESIPHIEEESGMYGYDGKSDYSDFSNIKEYVLYGIGSGRTPKIVRTAPMPLKIVGEDSSKT
jgi:hypothetical protein